jgi:hypothetical protein
MTREVHVCLANHSDEGRLTLIDHLQWLWAALDEIGVKMTVSDTSLRGDVPNVIFEQYNADFREVLDAHGDRIRLICYVTELIVGDKFDMRREGVERYQSFLALAGRYAGLLTSFPSNLDVLRRIAPATHFEFGFSERLLLPSNHDEWQHDYSFCGALSPYRREILKELGKSIPVFVPGSGIDGPPHTAITISEDEYAEVVKKTAINIGLKHYPEWKAPSPTKIPRILHACTGAAIEETPIKLAPASLCPTFSSAEDFLNKFAPLDRRKVFEEARERLARYRVELPLKREFERNLAECPALSP